MALGFARGSFNSVKRLYAEYNVVSPIRANQHTNKVAENAQEAAYDEETPELIWVPLNRVERRQTGLERAFIINDIHFPHHDPRAVAVALSMIEDLNPDVIFLAGDICDFYAISRYTKNPLRKLELGNEIALVPGFLHELRRVAGEDCRIVFIQGNHEQRLEDYLLKNAPELSVLEEYRVEHLLHLDKLNIEYERGKPNTKTAYAMYGGYRIGHFDSVAPQGGYTAQRLMSKWRSGIVQGHVHRLALVTYTDPEGNTFFGAESGCLCRLDADYVDAPNWQQGLTIITRWVDTDECHLEVVPITNHEAHYANVIYAG